MPQLVCQAGQDCNSPRHDGGASMANSIHLHLFALSIWLPGWGGKKDRSKTNAEGEEDREPTRTASLLLI